MGRSRGAVILVAIFSAACLGCVPLLMGLGNERGDIGSRGTSGGSVQAIVSPEMLAGLRHLEEPLGEEKGCLKIYHTAYTVAYSPAWQQARWVAYSLNRSKLLKVVSREVGRFKVDPALLNPTVNNADYRRSGYDKGHLAPAGDMVWSYQAMRESYYFTNISPQLPGFNRGIWKKLEERVRKLASGNDEVYVATGPYFYGGDRGHIGYPPIAVPTHFYKALLVRHQDEWRAVAYAIPHSIAYKEPRAFMITVDSLERLTGLDFFPLLPDSIEEKVEARLDRGNWD